RSSPRPAGVPRRAKRGNHHADPGGLQNARTESKAGGMASDIVRYRCVRRLRNPRSDALLFQRVSHPPCDHGGIVVAGERHGALESMRASDKDPESAIERVSSDPSFVRASRVLAASDHGSFDPLTTVA